MGLINKIEEKLGGSSSSNNDEQNRLQKPAPGDLTGSRTSNNTSGAPEQVRHPISSSGEKPTGSAVDNYSSNPSTSTTSGSGRQGTIPTSDIGNRVPQSSTSTGSRPVDTTQGYSEGPRQPYDPYSAKGQQTAASTATDPPGIQRSSDGGILSSNEDRDYSTRTAGQTQPTTGERQVPIHSVQPSQTSSSHHYGRDAGIVGGTGAAGVGAYELGQHSGTSSQAYRDPGLTSQTQSGIHPSASHSSEPSYVSRDTIGGQQHSSSRPFVDESAGPGGAGALGTNHGTSGISGETSGLSMSKKMGAAYEAGYRDGYEHAKAEFQGSQFR